ncbi:MAG: MBL fold metallo-hydrolase [Frankia sp.]
MRLTVLGCRSGMPADGQASSGYLVDSGSTRLLLDCGPGVAAALSGVMPATELDAVVISHLHLDHCYDVLPIGKTLLAGQVEYPMELPDTVPAVAPQPRGKVPLFVPVGARPILDQLAALFPVTTMPMLDRAFDLAFDVREYAPGDRLTVGDCEVTLYGLRHSAPNCGVRVESPTGSLAYTGDTGVTEALTDLARDVGIFLAEATLPRTDHGPHGHLSAADAARVAAAAGVDVLVLTHFITADPEYLAERVAEAGQHFDGPIRLSSEGHFEAPRPRETAR